MCLYLTASHIGKFLETSGMMKYIEKTWTTIMFYSSAGHQAIKESSPEYYKATVNLCTPYVKLANDVYLIVRNVSVKVVNNTLTYAGKKTPVIINAVSRKPKISNNILQIQEIFHNNFLAQIEHYVPGIIEQIHFQSHQALEFVKVYSVLIQQKVIEHSSATIQWLKQNVFV